jgi:hypothetical protein
MFRLAAFKLRRSLTAAVAMGIVPSIKPSGEGKQAVSTSIQ